MSLKVALFEEDEISANTLMEMRKRHWIDTSVYHSLKNPKWREANVVIGDFENKRVPFSELELECLKLGIPLLAISRVPILHHPHILRPFSAEELKDGIFAALVYAKEMGLKRAKKKCTLQSWIRNRMKVYSRPPKD